LPGFRLDIVVAVGVEGLDKNRDFIFNIREYAVY
jgi:hypothetical protein